MPIFYMDYDNGNDAADGSTFALGGLPAVGPLKTITGCTAAKGIVAGDIIHIAKSPAPSLIPGGNCKWEGTTKVGGGMPATKNIASSTNATPIEITIAGHGYSNGDVIQILAHAVNTSANGAWLIQNVTLNTFELVGSTPTGVGAATGTAQKINSKAVILGAAQTLNIDMCELAWTTGAGGDVPAGGVPTAVATEGKEGGYCCKFTTDAAVQINKLQAYRAFAAPLNLSGYQKISLWINNEAVIADATTWVIALCSDAVGAVVVDQFAIPAIPSQYYWIPLTITKTGGGNMGANINSIALYSKATAPANSKYIYLDNIIACTTAGLNLQSLISKNNLEQGGSEGWYGIQSINGTIVLLDDTNTTRADAGRGYSTSGTNPETVATYKRETIKTVMTIATAAQEIQVSGVLGSNIVFQGGYNTATDNPDGETFFNGLNGNSYGIYLNGKSYNTLNYISVCRYNTGVYFAASNNNTIAAIGNANNNTYGVVFNAASNNNTIITIGNANNNSGSGVDSSSNNNTIAAIGNANNNGNYGVGCTGSNNTIAAIGNANNNTYGVYFTANNNTIAAIGNANNNTYGVYFTANSNNNTIAAIGNANNNGNYGVYFTANSNNNTIRSLITTGNLTGGIYNSKYINYFSNAIIAEAVKVTGFTTLWNSRVYIQKFGGVNGINWIFTDNGTINSQVVTRAGALGYEWKFNITGVTRTSFYKLSMDSKPFAVKANKTVTVKAYFTKSHATDVAAQLRCQGGQIAGIAADVVAVKASDINPQQLTLTLLPTEDGTLMITFDAWYVTGLGSVLVDTVEVTQAT
jgi:hypothetical protein